MPKSKFDAVLEVDTHMHARGPLERDDVPLDAAIHILWMVEQNGMVAFGRCDGRGKAWHDHAEVVRGDWSDGPATAAGVLVILTSGGSKTEAWSERVKLKNVK